MRGMHELKECDLICECVCLTPCAAGSVSNVVDILNVTAGTWSTAALSAARCCLEATSLLNLGVAIFAGGQSTCCWFCLSCRMRRCFFREMHELQECDVLSVSVSHALCSGQWRLQCCGHLERDGRNLEHCCSQRSSIWSCSHIAAEPRSRDLRWWLEYVLLVLFELLHEALLCEGGA